MGKNRKPFRKRGKSYKVAKKKCAGCGTTNNLTIHHVKPKSEGGLDHPRNYMILCWKCHRREHEMFERILQNDKVE